VKLAPGQHEAYPYVGSMSTFRVMGVIPLKLIIFPWYCAIRVPEYRQLSQVERNGNQVSS